VLGVETASLLGIYAHRLQGSSVFISKEDGRNGRPGGKIREYTGVKVPPSEYNFILEPRENSDIAICI
jgi:hypothetical protein